MSDEPQWKKTKLSLERPYRDDHGERIPVLLDITPDGEPIFEPYAFRLACTRWLTDSIDRKTLPQF
jgi:hypothetical protein